MVALLNTTYDSFVDINTYITSEHNACKARYKSMDKDLISLLFFHITPTCFSTSKVQEDVSLGSIEKLFYLVNGNIYWVDKGGRLIIKKDLVKEVAAKVSSLKLDIKQTLGNNHGALLAIFYLTSSHQYFTDFVNWIEELFSELEAISYVDPKEAWALVLELWLAFLNDLRMVRSECLSILLAGADPNSTERKNIVAQYI